MKDAYTIKEVAQRLGVAEATVRKLIRTGDMPSIQISQRRIIIPVSCFTDWLERRAIGGEHPEQTPLAAR